MLDTGKLYDDDSLSDVMELMFAVMSAGRGHQESQRKSELIGDVWEERRKQAERGIITSGNLPCWLKREDKKAVVIEERVGIIRSIYEMSANKDMGVYAIRNALNDNPETQYWGHPSRVNKRDAHVWRHSFITRVLKDVSVLGWWKAHERLENGKRKPIGEPIKGAYPQIIAEDLFNLVQSKMAKRFNKGESGRRGKKLYQNLMRKIVYCECGSRLHLEQKGRSRAQNPDGKKPCYKYLTCFERCGHKPVNYYSAEEMLIDSLKNSDMREVLFGVNKQREAQILENQKVEATIEAREKRVAKLRSDYNKEQEEFRQEVLMDSMVDLKKEVAQLRKQIQPVLALASDGQKGSLQDLYGFDLATAGEDERKKIYNYILDTVEKVTTVQLDKTRSYMEVVLKNGTTLFHSLRFKSPRSKECIRFGCLASQLDWNVHEWQSELIDTMVFDEDGNLEDFKEPSLQRHRLDFEIDPVKDGWLVTMGCFDELDES